MLTERDPDAREPVAALCDEYDAGDLTLEQVRARATAEGIGVQAVGRELRHRYQHRVAGKCPRRLRGHDLCPLRAGHQGGCDGFAWND